MSRTVGSAAIEEIAVMPMKVRSGFRIEMLRMLKENAKRLGVRQSPAALQDASRVPGIQKLFMAAAKKWLINSIKCGDAG
jgi:hypothetical protein